jgi:serine/threonine protein kinase
MQPFALKHEIGDVVKERYSIREVLGMGAFGTVYRVEETIGVRTISLACKEMHVLSDPATAGDERADALRMFQEEAYLLQTLRHPHIPAAYFEQEKGVWLACPVCGRVFRGQRTCPDHGATLQVVRERYYLIMDFIEGPDLEQLLVKNGRPLEEEAVLDWALQICDALEAVHLQGLSHRDIKPANIKLQTGSNRAMLIDFGLVKPSEVAGGYGTVLKRGSTGIGTIGYAPELPAEQQHPDARTDILALGMTLYRLLSFRDPTEPGDLAQMRRSSPGNLNLRLSLAIDSIITQAIKVEPAERYPDIQTLRAEIRAARYPVAIVCPHCGHEQRSTLRPTADSACERCGRSLLNAAATVGTGGGSQTLKRTTRLNAGTPDPPVLVRPNPYEARLRQIQHQYTQPAMSQPFPGDGRIEELENQLAAIGRVGLGQGNRCPACQELQLVHVTGQPTGRCPLCAKGALARRAFDETQCAICRTGHLQDHVLNANELVCPVCRAAKLEEERRRRFGLQLDEWAVCPNCQAQFDLENHTHARLDSVGTDPHGYGAPFLGQTLPLDEWRALSKRTSHYAECDDCTAQWDYQTDGTMQLLRWTRDPHNIAAQYGGKALSSVSWAKLAANATLDQGNLHCTQCRAEYDYDRKHRTMCLLHGGTAMPSWANRFVGNTVPLTHFTFAAYHKESYIPGLLCQSCHTEFDTVGDVFKLVKTEMPRLKPLVGQILTLRDWNLKGEGLPAGSEAQALRNELIRLNAEKQAYQAQWQRDHQGIKAGMEKEFYDLLRQSVLGGFVPIQRMSQFAPPSAPAPGIYITIKGGGNRVPLRASESVLWESPARQCQVTVGAQGYIWRPHTWGVLLITGERLLFNPSEQDARLWQKPLAKIETVESHFARDAGGQNIPVILVTFSDGQTPMGLALSDVTWDIMVDGQIYPLTFHPHELSALLMHQIH